MVNNIRDNNPNIFGALVLKADGYVIGPVIVQFGKGLDLFLGIPADFLAVLECFGYRGDRHV